MLTHCGKTIEKSSPVRSGLSTPRMYWYAICPKPEAAIKFSATFTFQSQNCGPVGSGGMVTLSDSLALFMRRRASSASTISPQSAYGPIGGGGGGGGGPPGPPGPGGPPGPPPPPPPGQRGWGRPLEPPPPLPLPGGHGFPPGGPPKPGRPMGDISDDQTSPN